MSNDGLPISGDQSGKKQGGMTCKPPTIDCRYSIVILIVPLFDYYVEGRQFPFAVAIGLNQLYVL